MVTFEGDNVQVVVDGVPLKELDIKWFRKQLGVVSQVSTQGSYLKQSPIEFFVYVFDALPQFTRLR